MGGAPKSCSYSFDKAPAAGRRASSKPPLLRQALRRFTVNVEGEQPIELERLGVKSFDVQGPRHYTG